MANIESGSDVIDVRDIIERVEELRGEIEAFEPGQEDEDGLRDELGTLEGLLAELRGNGGDEQWEGAWYPITLINDGYFEEAMDSDMEDLGYIPKNLPAFIKITIDYDALKMDYSSVEYDGVTYWYR